MCILSPRQRCLESDFEWLRSESYDYNAGKEGKLHVEDRLSSQNSKRELNTTTCVRSYQETSISSLPGFLRIMFDDVLFNEAWVRGLVRYCRHTPWQGMILSNFQLETVLAFRFIVLVTGYKYQFMQAPRRERIILFILRLCPKEPLETYAVRVELCEKKRELGRYLGLGILET